MVVCSQYLEIFNFWVFFNHKLSDFKQLQMYFNFFRLTSKSAYILSLWHPYEADHRTVVNFVSSKFSNIFVLNLNVISFKKKKKSKSKTFFVINAGLLSSYGINRRIDFIFFKLINIMI